MVSTLQYKSTMRKIHLKNLVWTLLFLFTLSACNATSNANNKAVEISKPPQPNLNATATAYFASGCFWCVEAIYEHTRGVGEVVSGYSGGHTKNPTYESSNTGTTGHAEAVKVHYDPSVISFSQLIDIYFATQNQTQVNGQGPDHGSQYRSILFYQNEEEKSIIEAKKAALAKELNADIAAEVKKFEKFWVAEAYHQDYERLHPDNGYIRQVSIPRLNKLKEKYPDLVKK